VEQIWFYPGRRKLMPTPWVYKIPPLYFLKGLEREKEKPVFNYVKPMNRLKEVKQQNGLF
jgi:hypothetical protein